MSSTVGEALAGAWIVVWSVTMMLLTIILLVEPIERMSSLSGWVNGAFTLLSWAGFNLKGGLPEWSKLYECCFNGGGFERRILEYASFINATLSKVQALVVEFRGANFTGVCLHSWNINSSTNLEGAHAAYVFLLNNHKERRPSSGEFREGGQKAFSGGDPYGGFHLQKQDRLAAIYPLL